MVVIDIDMPESCQDCRAYGTSACDKWDKHRTFSDQRTKRHKDCPIVGEMKAEGSVVIAYKEKEE